jgi:hypothetical protein
MKGARAGRGSPANQEVAPYPEDYSQAWNDPRHESRRPRPSARNKGLEMQKGNVIRQL